MNCIYCHKQIVHHENRIWLHKRTFLRYCQVNMADPDRTEPDIDEVERRNREANMS